MTRAITTISNVLTSVTICLVLPAIFLMVYGAKNIGECKGYDPHMWLLLESCITLFQGLLIVLMLFFSLCANTRGDYYPYLFNLLKVATKIILFLTCGINFIGALFFPYHVISYSNCNEIYIYINLFAFYGYNFIKNIIIVLLL